MIRIEHDGMSYDELIRAFDEKTIKKALVRTQNRVLSSANTALSRSVRQTYAIKARDINKTKHITRANISKHDAILEYVGTRLPLSVFKPKEKTVLVHSDHFGKKIRRKQVTIKIRKDRRRAPIKTIPAFLSSLKQNVFYRTSDERLSISAATTISVPEMMNTERQREAFDRTVKERFPLELENNLNYYIERAIN